MANTLYITATEARSGKSAVCLGVMEMLIRHVKNAAFFRPIIGRQPPKKDNDLDLVSAYFRLDLDYDRMYAFTAEEAMRLNSQGRENEIIEGIISQYNHLINRHDFVLCEGTDFSSETSSFEFEINAEIAKNLASPVLLVAGAHGKSLEAVLRSVELAHESLEDHGCQLLGTIINRAAPEDCAALVRLLNERDPENRSLTFAIPEEPSLSAPTMAEIAATVKARVLYGQEQLNRHVHNYMVAAMQLRNFLPRIERGSLIITPGDRADVIVACLAAVSSLSMQNIAGLVLTGGLIPEEPIRKLIEGFPRMAPILSVETDTFPTASRVTRVHASITPDNDRKITRALAVFEKNVAIDILAHRIITTPATTITPKMFEFELLQRARQHRQHIVLPEGEEPRILKAAEILLRRNVVDLTLLGNEEIIQHRIDQLGLVLDRIRVVNPLKSEFFQDYCRTYHQLRRHRGVTWENAQDAMGDVSYFGTMMIYQGHADGMVSGSVHTTGHTIRPAFEFIKTKPGFSIVSSVFFMCLEDRVLVYGDCAINPNPTAPELAEIAVSSAETARTFGIEPLVAMLSYSTGESGKGEDVDRVREAAGLAQEMARRKYPGLKIEGPLQYDAAVDMSVARTKLPGSEVAGKATVFIFPDLNTGNNTYKAVQRSAGAVAIGPVLQGLKRPVNDLSRGCLVPDIVNTVAITAIQAQSEKGLR